MDKKWSQRRGDSSGLAGGGSLGIRWRRSAAAWTHSAIVLSWEEAVCGLGWNVLRQLREENAKLKRLVADLRLDRHVLQEIVAKKTVRTRARRELAEWAQAVHRMSQRRVARLIPIERMTLRYEHYRDPQEALRIRLRELAGSRVRYGYRRLTVLLKREGWEVNAKRIYRIYTEEGLIVRMKKRRGRGPGHPRVRDASVRKHAVWEGSPQTASSKCCRPSKTSLRFRLHDPKNNRDIRFKTHLNK